MVTIEMFFYYRGNTCDVERGRRDNGYVDPGSRDIDDEIMENADDVQLKQQHHRIYKILLIVSMAGQMCSIDLNCTNYLERYIGRIIVFNYNNVSWYTFVISIGTKKAHHYCQSLCISLNICRIAFPINIFQSQKVKI